MQKNNAKRIESLLISKKGFQILILKNQDRN